MTVIEAVAVVVPARDEEAALPGALASVDAAARAVACPVTTVVVCDSCRDGTLAVARDARVVAVQTAVGCAGGARRIGVESAARRLGAFPPGAVWVASTDADSVVRSDWLRTHLLAAEAGWDAYAGEVVVPDWSGWPEALPAAYERHYRRSGRRPPVHGANLGVRLDAYLAVGGFPAVACAEDQLLVDRLVSAGYRVQASSDGPVRTSARRLARASGGFSSYLRGLEVEILPRSAS